MSTSKRRCLLPTCKKVNRRKLAPYCSTACEHAAAESRAPQGFHDDAFTRRVRARKRSR